MAILGNFVTAMKQKQSMVIRGVQNSKKFDFNWVEWFFPLLSMPGVSMKNFRPLDQLEDPALAP